MGNREKQSSYRQHTDWYNYVCESVNTAVVTKFIKWTATECHVTGNKINSIKRSFTHHKCQNNYLRCG